MKQNSRQKKAKNNKMATQNFISVCTHHWFYVVCIRNVSSHHHNHSHRLWADHIWTKTFMKLHVNFLLSQLMRNNKGWLQQVCCFSDLSSRMIFLKLLSRATLLIAIRKKVHVYTLHRGAFCQFHFRWFYYYGRSKSNGKETDKTHCCALVWE